MNTRRPANDDDDARVERHRVVIHAMATRLQATALPGPARDFIDRVAVKFAPDADEKMPEDGESK